jgi:tetratricopeptide (TPR) repeat protein
MDAMDHKKDKINADYTRKKREKLRARVTNNPSAAESWAELAYVLMTDFLAGWNPPTENEPSLVLQAEEAVEKVMRAADPIDRLRRARAHLAKGWILREKGLHRFALKAFDEALKSNPGLATALVAKANQLLYLGQTDKALKLVKQAIHDNPDHRELGRFYWILGRVYFTLKGYDKAIDNIQKSIQLRPPTWFIRAQLISAYVLQCKKAVDEYKKYPKCMEWTLEEIKNFTMNQNIAMQILCTCQR